MATITVTIPDAQINRVRNAFATAYGWSGILPDGTPNPENKTQFTQRKVREYVKEVVKGVEATAAAETARAAAVAQAESDIVLT